MLPHKHDPHPDCPDTLTCLPDTDGRPQHTLPVILRCAILGSPQKRLTIREIYAAMEGKYAYYKTAGPTWKQSVRHHLSLNRLFERQPRPFADPGFGSYWTVNLSAPPGTKRPRKRGRPNKDVHDDVGAPPVKRRGRPRKNQSQTPGATGRPHYDVFDDQLEDDVPVSEGDQDSHISDDDYESEEGVPYSFEFPVNRNRTRGGWTSLQTLANSALPDVNINESTSNLIDRLKIEVEGLRRQSAEAVSLSLRMSDQLAEAQADASRTRAALRTAENMLEDEGRKRREAESAADEETRRRRTTEDALTTLQMQLSGPADWERHSD